MVGLGSILLIFCVNNSGLKNKKYSLDEKLKGTVNMKRIRVFHRKSCMARRMSEHN